MSRLSQTGYISMPLLGDSQVAERRPFSWRGLIILLACTALVVSLASRTIQLSAVTDPTVQSDSPQAKIQHLNKDAAQWTAPVASFLLFWLAVVSLDFRAEDKSPLTLDLDNCLYNRPPPLS
ncbi:MAG TPA: hypothetical protein VFJ47_06820 [Terriglobales bacterium]|nr:hypothetical protein [Terriglobales bacterium]